MKSNVSAASVTIRLGVLIDVCRTIIEPSEQREGYGRTSVVLFVGTQSRRTPLGEAEGGGSEATRGRR